MTNKHPKIHPPSHPSAPPPAPVAALERPQGLKRWSSDLVGILAREAGSVFDGWDFRPGDLTRADFTRILKKITGCGSVVELRSKLDRGTGEMTPPAVHAANFCGQHTVCPYCAGRVQDRRKARFRDAIMGAARKYRHAYLVTATIPPVPTWREDLNLLLESWKTFRKMGQVRRRRRKDGTVKVTRSGGEWAKVAAGLAKVEIKRGENSGLPHCHIHALFFTDEFLDYRVWAPAEKEKDRAERASLHAGNASKISLEWTAATDGRATGINVRKITWRPAKRAREETLKHYRERAENWSYADSVVEQAREVLKYATKFDSAPATGAEALFAKDFIGIKAATYGRRLFHTYGDFRSIGGGDFVGGACALKENPVIYETRWNSDRYTALRERSRPVFGNMEPGPALTARLQVLNRIQGATRRTRRAINERKREYFAGGALAPAVVMGREYLEAGGFRDVPVVMEVPGYVLAEPANPDAWEKWVDAATEQGRGAYATAREWLDVESHFRITETPDERAAVEDLARRALWNSEDYQAQTVRMFLRTLEATRADLAPSSAPP
jgi:hypothetical protein